MLYKGEEEEGYERHLAWNEGAVKVQPELWDPSLGVR